MKKFMKRAEKDKNRIIIPKFVIDNFGRDFYMEINEQNGTMVITPIKYEKKGN